MPNRISDFKERTSSSASHKDCMSKLSFLPQQLAQLKQFGTNLSFSASTLFINTFNVSLLKFTFVIVEKSPSNINLSVTSFTKFSFPSVALAKPIKAPVSSSCSWAVSAFFPHTPCAPVHALHPAVCSH